MKQKALVRGLIGAALAVGLISGYPLIHDMVIHPAHADDTAAKAPMVNVQPATMGLPDFTSLVSRYGPAVVNITVTEKPQKTVFNGSPDINPNDPFYQFFRQFGMNVPSNPAPMEGLGSGFIISPDGVILTNAHVVDNATEVTVKLTDKREFRAKVLGVDRPTDVAVLKINAKNLPTVKVGSVKDVKVGEWVIAIGSPYGFDNTVTAGIVSAKARALPGETYIPFLQTDVAVNPGNSGGPLFDMNGDVIGINSQIYTQSGGYQGLSFAVPINVAMHVKDQLLKTGHVTRGRLGVLIQDVNQALADSFGLKRPDGALVASVEKDSPAAKAGLKPGDVITAFNGHHIESSSQLPVLVANTAPGTRATLDVIHKGSKRQVGITVGELKNTQVAANTSVGGDHGRLGLVVRPLDPQEQKEMGVHGGLLVKDATGPAALAGIQQGDVILAFNNTPVKSVEQLRALLSKAGKHIALLVQRDNLKTYVPINLG